MSYRSEPIADTSSRVDTNQEQVTEKSMPLQNEDHESSTTRRSEVLRHVFPRSSRRPAPHSRAGTPRISKPEHYRSALLYRRQSKPRGAFHKVISSFFGNTSCQETHSISPQARSRASSFGSRPGSSVYGSVPSFDLVSPGAFLFSGPSLQSAGSLNNSTSKLPSLAGSLGETHVFRRIRSESFSMVDNVSVEDELLEPVVGQGVVRSMSDVLLGVNTPVEEVGDPMLNDETALLDSSSAFRSKDTWSNSSLSRNNLFQFPIVASIVVRFVDIQTWKNIRLTCRSWYNAVSAIVPPARPASSRLPTEILLSIYSNLGPKDYNAARRTCRGWMMASLNKGLLVAMLSRGGWLRTKDQEATQSHLTTASNEEWILSQDLSRQCALASRWTGNGVDPRSAIVESTEVDMSELAHGYAPQKGRSSGGLIFTSSICGKYLMVAKDTLIYIYGLGDGLLQPLTSVVCPRRVLTMSMNASVGRDAIAALLEGRMGMVCELQYGRSSPGSDTIDTCVEGDGYPPRTSTQSSASTGETSDLQDAIDSAEHTSPRVLRSFPYAQHPEEDTFSAVEVRSHNQGFSLWDTDDATTHDRNLINQTWNLSLRGPVKNLRASSKTTLPVPNIPIESSTSTFYRRLCSEDDPPRNVSICPQRRCVAFGCSAGIELHWIDALTGQSLSRWFPLTSPSDHLYFLSPRPGFESAKKLRLISSAAHPDHRPAIGRKLFSHQTMSSFWGSLGFESRSRDMRSCEHYHAIPLSDGHHVLFVNPVNDRLTLGCDAPLGGPTKLLCKIVFHPPEEKGVPRLYTAAADMSSGARVVVVYDDTIVLYSIPPNVLDLSRLEQAAESTDIYSHPPFSTEGRHPDHWLNWWDELDSTHRSNGGTNTHIWPLHVSGTVIGKLSSICEVAMQTRPDLLIWAFTYTAQCRTWRLRNFVDALVRRKQYIDGSGLVQAVHDVVDGGRDVIKGDEAVLFDGGVYGLGCMSG